MFTKFVCYTGKFDPSWDAVRKKADKKMGSGTSRKALKKAYCCVCVNVCTQAVSFHLHSRSFLCRLVTRFVPFVARGLPNYSPSATNWKRVVEDRERDDNGMVMGCRWDMDALQENYCCTQHSRSYAPCMDQMWYRRWRSRCGDGVLVACDGMWGCVRTHWRGG